MSDQPGWNHTGIVDNQAVSRSQLIRKIGKPEMANCTVLSVEAQQS
jgi:hypothetical protein